MAASNSHRLLNAGVAVASLAGAWFAAPEGNAATVLGLNHIALASEFQGYLGGCTPANPDCMTTVPEMAQKATQDAGDLGATFFRVAITGYGPQTDAANASTLTWELAPWFNDIDNPNSLYWQNMINMFKYIDHKGVHLVPSFLFNPLAFPYYVRDAAHAVSELDCSTKGSLNSETIATMIQVPTSCSRMLLKRYINDFISHYKAYAVAANRHTVLFYEFGNETNLLADLDFVAGCAQANGAANCSAYGNFTTLDLNKFAADIIQTIKLDDPGAQVESGYAFPGPKAFGILQHPVVAPTWQWPATSDSEMQTETLLRILHGTQTNSSYPIAWPQVQPGLAGGCPIATANVQSCMFDIASGHIYHPQAGNQYWFTPTDGSCPVGAAGCDNWEKMVYSLTQIGIPAFVGEFGDQNSAAVGSNGTPSAALQSLVAAMQKYSTQIQYAAPWAWEFYGYPPAKKVAGQFRAMNVVKGSIAFSRVWDPLQPVSSNLEPEFTDGFNAWLTQAFGTHPNFVDTGMPPRVVLTSLCSQLPNTFTVYAAASARDRILNVSFAVTGLPVGVTLVQSPISVSTPTNSGTLGSIGYSATFAFAQPQQGTVSADVLVTATGRNGNSTTASQVIPILQNGQAAGALFCSYPR